MSALPTSDLISNVPLHFAHWQMSEAWSFLRYTSERAEEVPDELKIFPYFQEQKIQLELPHIPMSWDRAYMRTNMSLLSFL